MIINSVISHIKRVFCRGLYAAEAIIPRLAAVCVLVACGSMALCAETVSQKEARSLAQRFFSEVYHETVPAPKLVYNGKRLTTNRLFTPFYVYNSARGGWVMLSAENKTFPILAYSLEGAFDPDALNDAQRGWLAGYARDIENIRYDATPLTAAPTAWQRFGQYVDALLRAPLQASVPRMSATQAAQAIDNIISAPGNDYEGDFSAWYTPAQFQDAVDAQLTAEGQLALGYVDLQRRVYAGVAYGRQGDYYRIDFGTPDAWLLRLAAGEVMADRLVADFKPVPQVDSALDDGLEDAGFYASYAAELERMAWQHKAAEAGHNGMPGEISGGITALGAEPIVHGMGDGRYEIVMPEEVRLATVYTLSGGMAGQYTFAGQPVAHIALEHLPHGFYIVRLIGRSGRPYGFKLAR